MQYKKVKNKIKQQHRTKGANKITESKASTIKNMFRGDPKIVILVKIICLEQIH